MHRARDRTDAGNVKAEALRLPVTAAETSVRKRQCLSGGKPSSSRHTSSGSVSPYDLTGDLSSVCACELYSADFCPRSPPSTKDAHTFTPRIWDDGTPRDKRLYDVIKVMELRWEVGRDYLGEPNPLA